MALAGKYQQLKDLNPSRLGHPLPYFKLLTCQQAFYIVLVPVHHMPPGHKGEKVIGRGQF